MMRIAVVAVALLGIGIGVGVARDAGPRSADEDAASAPAGLAERLAAVVREHFPDAEVVLDGETLRAKHGTMVFTVHQRWKTGEVSPKTDQVEGPNFGGFVLEVTPVAGRYVGAAVVPQTLREPYWETYIDRPPTSDGEGHLTINFSFGSRLDRDFKRAVLEAL